MNKGTLVASAMTIGSLLAVVLMIRFILSPDSKPGEVVWQYKAAGAAGGPMQITPSTGVAVLLGANNKLTAVNGRKLNQLWSFNSSGTKLLYSPAVVHDPLHLLISGEDNNGGLYALFAQNGTVAWTASLGATTALSPVTRVLYWPGSALATLSLLFGAGNGFRSYNLTIRAMQWTYATDGQVNARPAYCQAINAAIAASAGGYVYAVQMWSGQLLWRVQAGSLPLKTPPVVANTVIILPFSSGEVVALNAADGSVTWSHQLDGNNVVAAPVLLERMVLFGSGDGSVTALSLASGQTVWRNVLPSGGAVAFMAANDFSVFAAARSGHVAAFSLLTGELEWTKIGTSFNDVASLSLLGTTLLLHGSFLEGIETVITQK